MTLMKIFDWTVTAVLVGIAAWGGNYYLDFKFAKEHSVGYVRGPSEWNQAVVIEKFLEASGKDYPHSHEYLAVFSQGNWHCVYEKETPVVEPELSPRTEHMLDALPTLEESVNDFLNNSRESM